MVWRRSVKPGARVRSLQRRHCWSRYIFVIRRSCLVIGSRVAKKYWHLTSRLCSPRVIFLQIFFLLLDASVADSDSEVTYDPRANETIHRERCDMLVETTSLVNLELQLTLLKNCLALCDRAKAGNRDRASAILDSACR